MPDGQRGGSVTSCVDSATLAAFVDGTLDSANRARVIAHLAACPDCAELVGEIVQTTDELSRVEPIAQHQTDVGGSRTGRVLWMRRRGFFAIAGAAAVAASLLLVVFMRGAPLDPLVASIGAARLTLGRPTGGFHYGPLRSPLRGAGEIENLRVTAELVRLRARAQQTNNATDLHAAGVAELLAGHTASAIETLQKAVRLNADDATFIADLGTASMTQFVERGDPRDAAAALDSLDTAIARSPSLREAWFNKALLLERMNRPADALAAWDRYLALPSEQGWHDEARKNRDALQLRLR